MPTWLCKRVYPRAGLARALTRRMAAPFGAQIAKAKKSARAGEHRADGKSLRGVNSKGRGNQAPGFASGRCREGSRLAHNNWTQTLGAMALWATGEGEGVTKCVGLQSNASVASGAARLRKGGASGRFRNVCCACTVTPVRGARQAERVETGVGGMSPTPGVRISWRAVCKGMQRVRRCGRQRAQAFLLP